ncbi:MAG: S41 family peptidase [Pseudomonadota bacterium]
MIERETEITWEAISNRRLNIDGTRILSINAMPVSKLWSELALLLPADGPAATLRQAKGGITGYRFLDEGFDVFQPLLVPPIDGNYALSVAIPGRSGIRDLTVKAVSREGRADRLADANAKWPKRREDLWGFEDLGDEVAYMKVGSFVTWRFERPWKDYLEDFFSQLEKGNFQHLIVDLRGNSGGADAPAQALFERFIKEPCSVAGFEEGSRYTVFPEALSAYASSWNDTWRRLSAQPTHSTGVYH